MQKNLKGNHDAGGARYWPLKQNSRLHNDPYLTMGCRVKAETLQREDAGTRRRRGERWRPFVGASCGAYSSRFANNVVGIL